MRIAQVSPLYESCPPRLYGGTERVVSYLTEELVRQGHEVTLFASGDSDTAATLRAPCAEALRLDSKCEDTLPYHLVMMNHVARSRDAFDIIHFHTDFLHFPTFAPLGRKTLTTAHGRLDLPDLPFLFREFPMMPLVSISDAQRIPLAWANWHGTVYHGLPTSLYALGRGQGGYFAFMGRICPEKGVERAIAIARHSGMPLRIAAKVDNADMEYYKTKIERLLNDSGIEFIGEISDSEKGPFLGEATALLFPINWPEPFGLVMIEAMANGTPVIGLRCGSVPEIIDEGITGFVIDSSDEALAVLPQVLKLDRRAVRHRFEERFSVQRMARDYVALYDKALRRRIADAMVLADPTHQTTRDAA
jgi:glycosyltransferase involved in cell wall biosynthesis